MYFYDMIKFLECSVVIFSRYSVIFQCRRFDSIQSAEAAESPEPLPDSEVAASSPPAVLVAVVPLPLLLASELSPPVLPHATRLTIMVLANNAEITFFFIWCPPCVLRSFWCVPLLFLSRLTNHLSFTIIRFA